MSRRDDFERELARIVRRQMRLRAALAGDASVKRVRVEEVWVRRHKRGAHDRLVITLKKDATK